MGGWPTEPTEQYFGRGLWGFDGTLWRKLPLIFGYSDRLCEVENESNVAAGDQVLTFDAVPSGEIWVVNMTGSYNTTTAVDQQHFFYDGSVNFVIKYYAAQPAATWAINDNVWYVLKAGDRFKIKFFSCVLNDDIYGRLWGYKMEVG